MSLFNELGQRVERLKRSATEAADRSADHRCTACDARFHTEYEECPECGAEAVTTTSD